MSFGVDDGYHRAGARARGDEGGPTRASSSDGPRFELATLYRATRPDRQEAQKYNVEHDEQGTRSTGRAYALQPPDARDGMSRRT